MIHPRWVDDNKIHNKVKRNKPKVDLNNILEAHRTLMDFVSALSFAWNINFKKQILQMFNETKYYGWYLVYWWQDCFNVLYKEFKLLIQSIKLLLKLLRHIQMNYTKSHGKTSWLQGCFHGGYTLSWRTTVGANKGHISSVLNCIRWCIAEIAMWSSFYCEIIFTIKFHNRHCSVLLCYCWSRLRK